MSACTSSSIASRTSAIFWLLNPPPPAIALQTALKRASTSSASASPIASPAAAAPVVSESATKPATASTGELTSHAVAAPISYNVDHADHPGGSPGTSVGSVTVSKRETVSVSLSNFLVCFLVETQTWNFFWNSSREALSSKYFR